jgi:hypothetical protein
MSLLQLEQVANLHPTDLGMSALVALDREQPHVIIVERKPVEHLRDLEGVDIVTRGFAGESPAGGCHDPRR